MIELSCLCGQLHLTVTARPAFIHECNCMLCRKTGARWSYHHPSEVMVVGRSAGYSRADKAEPASNVRFCETCGSTTHFTLTQDAITKFGNTMMGVNMLLADQKDIEGIELRFPDGGNWDGASEFGYIRPPRIIEAI